jgi:hypothetical protein
VGSEGISELAGLGNDDGDKWEFGERSDRDLESERGLEGAGDGGSKSRNE